MKTCITTNLLVLAISFIVGGCATTGSEDTLEMSSTVFSDSGMPKQEYLVGGGYMINYTAPTNGTVYWVETTTEQILITKSLEEGENFEVDEGPSGPGEVAEFFGIPTSDVRLKLYFVPTSTRR